MKISDTVAQVIQMRLLLIKFYLYPFRWLLDQLVRVKLRKISKGTLTLSQVLSVFPFAHISAESGTWFSKDHGKSMI